jgi:hypothetical protein
MTPEGSLLSKLEQARQILDEIILELRPKSETSSPSDWGLGPLSKKAQRVLTHDPGAER